MPNWREYACHGITGKDTHPLSAGCGDVDVAAIGGDRERARPAERPRGRPLEIELDE